MAVASKRLGRPVKWIEDRSENLLAAGHAREEQLEVSAAITPAGELLGLKVAMVMDQGAYQLTTWPSSILPTLVRVCLPGGYRLRNFRFEAVVVATTKGTYIPYRGPWEVETWVRERMLDVIARHRAGSSRSRSGGATSLHASDRPPTGDRPDAGRDRPAGHPGAGRRADGPARLPAPAGRGEGPCGRLASASGWPPSSKPRLGSSRLPHRPGGPARRPDRPAGGGPARARRDGGPVHQPVAPRAEATRRRWPRLAATTPLDVPMEQVWSSVAGVLDTGHAVQPGGHGRQPGRHPRHRRHPRRRRPPARRDPATASPRCWRPSERTDLELVDGTVAPRGHALPAALITLAGDRVRRLAQSGAAPRQDLPRTRGRVRLRHPRRRLDARHPLLLGRGRPPHRWGADPALPRGRGLRLGHQPGDRRRPDPGRGGAGDRSESSSETGGLRRGWTAT